MFVCFRFGGKCSCKAYNFADTLKTIRPRLAREERDKIREGERDTQGRDEDAQVFSRPQTKIGRHKKADNLGGRSRVVLMRFMRHPSLSALRASAAVVCQRESSVTRRHKTKDKHEIATCNATNTSNHQHDGHNALQKI